MISFYISANSHKRQIIVRTLSDKIREEALKKSWNLEQLKRQSMRIKSALHGTAELSGEA